MEIGSIDWDSEREFAWLVVLFYHLNSEFLSCMPMIQIAFLQ
ncbi:unnamed protein product [Rhodiola kirilowii]